MPRAAPAVVAACVVAGPVAAQQSKVVVLNLWATWCTPCLKESPDLMQLEREFAAKRIQGKKSLEEFQAEVTALLR
jgi:thiol-disulfide isomerase/thioredoxin